MKLNKEHENIKHFINAKEVKGSDYYLVENCLINQIVMEMYGVKDAVKLPSLDDVYSYKLSFPENLKDYQYSDVQKMSVLNCVANFNRMGYGKTVEACKAMRELQVSNAVIVAPKTVLLQWKKQVEHWCPDLKGRVDIFNANWQPNKNRVVLINYEKLINDKNLQKLKRFTWDVIIADEAHRIKNRKSKRSKAVRSIPGRVKWAMTGTPITRLADDLWGILNFLGSYYSSKSYWNFVYYFCDVEDGFFGINVKGLTSNVFRLEVLHEMLNRMAVINRDLGITPGKVRETVSLEMDSKQRKLYRDTKNLLLQELPEELTIANGAVLVTRLMQITSNPGQWLDGVEGVKFEYIKEFLKDNTDLKVVIFSKFEKTCATLQKYLKEASIKTVKYTGREDSVSRYENCQKFITDNSVQAIIGTIGAMGEGVDGLQDVASVVIFIDRDWSPELVAQAEDRLNRFGQKHEVLVQFLECDKTFDQKVARVNFKKAEDIRKALLDESVWT